MNKPKVIAYLKTDLRLEPGSPGRAAQYDLPFEDRNMIRDPAQRQEMIEKSGQTLRPCVEIDGHMLADISGEEVENYLLPGLVKPTDRVADMPTNQPCPNEM